MIELTEDDRIEATSLLKLSSCHRFAHIPASKLQEIKRREL